MEPLRPTTTGILSVGIDRLPIKVLTASTTEVTLFSRRAPDFGVGDLGGLELSEGGSSDGEVVRIDDAADGYVIVFRRANGETDTKQDAVDLRIAFPVGLGKDAPHYYAAFLIVGLATALLLQVSAVQRFLTRLAAELGFR